MGGDDPLRRNHSRQTTRQQLRRSGPEPAPVFVTRPRLAVPQALEAPMRIEFNRGSGLRATGAAGVLVLAVVALAGAQSGDAGLETIRVDALKGHVFFLAAPATIASPAAM